MEFWNQVTLPVIEVEDADQVGDQDVLECRGETKSEEDGGQDGQGEAGSLRHWTLVAHVSSARACLA